MNTKDDMKFVVDVLKMTEYAERFNKIRPIPQVERVENPDLEFYLDQLFEACHDIGGDE